MENTIENLNREIIIGYRDDFIKGYKKEIKELLDNDDINLAKILMGELDEICECENHSDLLVISENNGMGFSCKPLVDIADLTGRIVNRFEMSGDTKEEIRRKIEKVITEYIEEIM